MTGELVMKEVYVEKSRMHVYTQGVIPFLQHTHVCTGLRVCIFTEKHTQSPRILSGGHLPISD